MGAVQSSSSSSSSTCAAVSASPYSALLDNVQQPTVAANQATLNNATARTVPARPAKLGDAVPLDDAVQREMEQRRANESDAAKLVDGHCSVYNSRVAYTALPLPAKRDCVEAERQRYMDARVAMRLERVRGFPCHDGCKGRTNSAALNADRRRLDAALDMRERRQLYNKRPTQLEATLPTLGNGSAAATAPLVAPPAANTARNEVVEQLSRSVQSV